MPQPFYGSGNVPQRHSTRKMVLAKLIAVLGGSGINAVSRNDTYRKSRLKIERIQAAKTNPA